MQNKYRTCLCCGTEYNYCPSCRKDHGKPNWMTVYCSENCKDIFDAATEYFFDHITKEEAKELIEQCDLSNIDTFLPCVKEDVYGILDEPELEAEG